MTVAILIENDNGQFSATLPGVPELATVGWMRGEAIEGIRAEIQKRVDTGELVTLEVRSRGIAALAGAFRDDPTLRDLCDDIYRELDADPREY